MERAKSFAAAKLIYERITSLWSFVKHNIRHVFDLFLECFDFFCSLSVRGLFESDLGQVNFYEVERLKIPKELIQRKCVWNLKGEIPGYLEISKNVGRVEAVEVTTTQVFYAE